MKTIHFLYLSIVSFFLFFFLTIFIINGNQIFFDIPFYEFLIQFPYSSFFKFITNFGNVYYLTLFLFLAYLLIKNKSKWNFMVCLMIFDVIINLLLKTFFKRPRPSVMWLVHETGFSFPSGHMMASTMFYGLCIYFLWKSSLNKLIKIIGSLLNLFMIIAIGTSRIYLGVHYLSDVLGGFLISSCILCFGIFFYQSMHQKKEESI